MQPSEIVEQLRAHNAFLCTAESCTGGLLVNELTDIPGASDVIWGGLVTYDNSAKQDLLKIPDALILKYGAVSPEIAQAMANGCVRVMSDACRDKTLNRKTLPRIFIGVSLTGVAGPGGGTPAKPVGLCHIGLSTIDLEGNAFQRTFEIRNSPEADRASQKKYFAEQARRILYDYLSRHHS